MALDIGAVKGALESVVALVNAEEKLRQADFALIGQQILDADEGELNALVLAIQGLDLQNDVLEAKIKSVAAAGAAPLAFILKLVKILFPKQP